MTAKAARQFVRYRNRKLHEIGDGNPYTTMEELLAIVRDGHNVIVVDDETNDDITAWMLGRAIYDQLRSKHDSYPVSALQRLIMTSGSKAA